MERSLTSLVNFYSTSGHEVSVINLFKTDLYFELNEEVIIVWPSIERNKYNRFIYAILITPYFRKSIRKLKPDAIICFGEWFNPYTILATTGLKPPLFISDRMGPNLNLGLLMEIARRSTYKFATGIIAQTSRAAEIIRKKTKARNISVIPNAVTFINSETKTKKKQIVTVGRLSKEKGHIFLLNAFSQINNKEWTLHIIGDGPQRNLLVEGAHILGINDRVIFYGHLKDFSKILGESEIFVLPSVYEGFPNALVEAMSVPLACISTDCIAGPSDIISNGINGILVKQEDPVDLAEAIKKLIEDAELRARLSNEAFKVRQTFKFDVIAEEYLKFVFPDLSMKR
ncbi:MAG: hypothetical protein C0412_13820 [Flavobacterium sp.]|nr:hypothetical protein [Flavobacterium sp.]